MSQKKELYSNRKPIMFETPVFLGIGVLPASRLLVVTVRATNFVILVKSVIRSNAHYLLGSMQCPYMPLGKDFVEWGVQICILFHVLYIFCSIHINVGNQISWWNELNRLPIDCCILGCDAVWCFGGICFQNFQGHFHAKDRFSSSETALGSYDATPSYISDQRNRIFKAVNTSDVLNVSRLQ
jgi:hypothetical protein